MTAPGKKTLTIANLWDYGGFYLSSLFLVPECNTSLGVIYPGHLNITKTLLEELLKVMGLPLLGEP